MVNLFQLRRNLFAQRRRFGHRTFRFAAFDRGIAEGNRLERNHVAGNGRVRADGALAAAAHAAQKRALSRHRLKSFGMIQPGTNLRDAFIVRPRLDANRALADARQHLVQTDYRCEQARRHRVATDGAIGIDREF